MFIVLGHAYAEMAVISMFEFLINIYFDLGVCNFEQTAPHFADLLPSSYGQS